MFAGLVSWIAPYLDPRDAAIGPEARRPPWASGAGVGGLACRAGAALPVPEARLGRQGVICQMKSAPKGG